MLPMALDVEDQVLKWLTMSARQYLQQGSPVIDYSQEVSTYIKTTQGDIDIGQHFKKFRLHPIDQPTLGVWYTYTNNTGDTEERKSWFRLIAAHLEIDVHLTYVVKGKQESWRSVKEIQVLRRTCSSLHCAI